MKECTDEGSGLLIKLNLMVVSTSKLSMDCGVETASCPTGQVYLEKSFVCFYLLPRNQVRIELLVLLTYVQG